MTTRRSYHRNCFKKAFWFLSRLTADAKMTIYHSAPSEWSEKSFLFESWIWKRKATSIKIHVSCWRWLSQIRKDVVPVITKKRARGVHCTNWLNKITTWNSAHRLKRRFRLGWWPQCFRGMWMSADRVRNRFCHSWWWPRYCRDRKLSAHGVRNSIFIGWWAWTPYEGMADWRRGLFFNPLDSRNGSWRRGVVRTEWRTAVCWEEVRGAAMYWVPRPIALDHSYGVPLRMLSLLTPVIEADGWPWTRWLTLWAVAGDKKSRKKMLIDSISGLRAGKKKRAAIYAHFHWLRVANKSWKSQRSFNALIIAR